MVKIILIFQTLHSVVTQVVPIISEKVSHFYEDRGSRFC
jgi:hypothetical protein